MNRNIIITALLLTTGIISSNNQNQVKVITGKHIDVINVVQNYLPKNPIILEAGAYDGKDTQNMKSFWPSATIYSFEPDPENFKKLSARTKNLSAVYISSLALSDTNGQATFYRSDDPKHKDNKQSGSLLEPKDHLKYSPVTFDEKIIVPTITIDTWATKNNVQHIDLLWLDMQGAELLALKAGQSILKTVTAIYTEVEFVEAYKEQALYGEIKQWLEEQGFTMIAQDFPIEKNNRWYGNIAMIRLP